MTSEKNHVFHANILVVDDIPENLKLLGDILRAEGYNICLASNGDQALNLVENSKPDLILLDIKMPGIDGFEVCRRLQQNDQTKAIPIIFITASRAIEEVVKGLRLGAVDYIMKPHFMEEVLARVSTHLENSQMRSHLEALVEGRTHELQQSRKKYRSLVESTSDWIWEVDQHMVFTYSSPNVREILGYEPKDIIGKTPFDLMPPVEAKRVADKARSIIETKKDFKGLENSNLHKDGHVIVLETNGTAILDGNNGELLGYRGINRDITMRKQTEESLTRTNYMLGERVKELQCLNAITAIIQKQGGSLDEVIQSTGNLIPPAFQYPDICHARITYNEKEIQSVGFEKSRWVLVSPIVISNDHVGSVEVFYSEEKPTCDDGPFLSEEKQLIDQVAQHLGDYIKRRKLEQESEHNNIRLRQELISTIRVIAKTVEARDPYTAGHQLRVSQLARAIGQEMGLDSDQVEGIRLGALIHDIGKLQVPSDLLSKPSKLSANEFAVIKDHAAYGYNILKDIEFPWPIADMAHQHHERLDGSGYPQGLKGNAICLDAKIIAVADVVEAISSHRPYRPGLGIDKALDEIEAHKGMYYQPDIVDICLKLFRKKGFSFS